MPLIGLLRHMFFIFMYAIHMPCTVALRFHLRGPVLLEDVAGRGMARQDFDVQFRVTAWAESSIRA